MPEPLAPRNPRLDTYAPGQPSSPPSPFRRWSSEEQQWVPVEIAKTPLQEARIQRRKLEEYAERTLAEALAAKAVLEAEAQPEPEQPVQHLHTRPRAPWWRRYHRED